MELRGSIKGLASTFPKRKILIELETDGRLEDIEKLQGKDLDITFKVHREKRSLDANAFLWSCLGKMGGVLNVPAWDMYLYSLERYGKYTYIQILESAYEDLKRMWRETKVVGDFMSVNMITGEKEKFLEVLCFFGSSTYNSKEFSRLLEGVISDMEQMGLERPTDEHLQAIIEEVEKRYFEKEFSEELKGLDFLQKKKIEYEFTRYKHGLGRRLKLTENEILLLNHLKELDRKKRAK